jgi:hypothetical protein
MWGCTKGRKFVIGRLRTDFQQIEVGNVKEMTFFA